MRLSPRRPKSAEPPLFPDAEEPTPANDEMTALREENAQLKNEVSFLNDRHTETADALERMQNVPYMGPGVLRHELLVLIMALVLLGRFAIYQFAPMPHIVSEVADVLFGLAGGAVLVRWMTGGWAVERWMLIPRGTLIVTGIFISGSLCTGGSFLIAKELAKRAPGAAAGVLLVLLIFAASPICRFAMAMTLKFLDHPISLFASRRKDEPSRKS
jgi:hypothetical protein